MCGRFTSISLFPHFQFYLHFKLQLALHSSVCIKFHFKSYGRLPCKYSLFRKKTKICGNRFVGKRKNIFHSLACCTKSRKLIEEEPSVDKGIFLQFYNMEMKWDMIWLTQYEKLEIIMSRILFFNTYCTVRAEHDFVLST